MTREQAVLIVPGTEIMIYGTCRGLVINRFEKPQRAQLWVVDEDGIGASLLGSDGIIVNVPFQLAHVALFTTPELPAPVQVHARILELVRLQQHVAIRPPNSKLK